MEEQIMEEVLYNKEEKLKELKKFLDGSFEVNSIDLSKCRDADLYDFFTEVNDGISNGRYNREEVNKILSDFFDGSFEDIDVIEVEGNKTLVIKGDEYKLL